MELQMGLDDNRRPRKSEVKARSVQQRLVARKGENMAEGPAGPV